jgi:hypothetical protein
MSHRHTPLPRVAEFTDLDRLELLDFTPDEVKCETISLPCHERGEHAADWYANSHCRGVIAVCDREVKRWAGMVGLASRCTVCGTVRVIKGPRIIGPVR